MKARSFIRSSQLDFFPSLFKEKKFIDTVDGLTILIGEKNKDGSFKDIFLKDQINEKESQIVFSKKGSIVSNLNNKNYLELNNGKIINNSGEKSTVINFEKTSFNLSNYATKTTTFPKLQETNTKILLSCIVSLTNIR